MSKYPFFLRWMSLPLATVLGVALTMTAQTPVLGREASPARWIYPGRRRQRLRVDPQAVGGPAIRLAANGPRDVVILVSTAASQTGDYRAKSLATLQSLLAKLDPNDRVKLVAFDLNATPLTQGFVAPNSAEMAAALGALDQRTPLGSCDLEKALDTAAKSFAGDSKSAAGHRLYRRRQQPRQPALDRSTRPRGQRSGCPAGAGDRLWSRSPNPRADARHAGLPHRGRGRA